MNVRLFTIYSTHICASNGVRCVSVAINSKSNLKCTTNFYFENNEVGIKTTIANFKPLFTLNISACLHIFMQHPVNEKRVLMKLTTLFISSNKSHQS